MRASNIAISIALVGLSACASAWQMPQVRRLGSAPTSESPQNTATRDIERHRAKAWRLLSHRSEVQSVGNARLEIIARGSLGNGIQKVEDTFLARAAAETLRHGFQTFSIRYLVYESEFPLNTTNGFIWPSDPVSISDYESYLSHTREQRLFFSASALGFKRLKGVVLMTDANGAHSTNGFDARAVYDGLISQYGSR